MEYQEIQANEVEALKAIYASDFHELPSKPVWNQPPSPKFQITLKPSSEFESSKLEIQIQISMTATYPKSLPKIEIVKTDSLSGRQIEVLKTCIDLTTKELKGNEMIYEVATNIQNQIDEWARSVHEAAPNLEQDRLQRLKLEENKQKEIQDEIQRERELHAQQEEKKFDSLILEELQKSNETNESSKNDQQLRFLVVPENTPNVTTYRRAIRVSKGPNGAPIAFKQVMSGLKVYQPFFGSSYLSKALIPTQRTINPNSGSNSGGNPGGDSDCDTDSIYDMALMLTKVRLSSEFWRSSEGARILNELNTEMEMVRQFRHIGITPLYEFTIERFKSSLNEWEITYLVPYTNVTLLSDILDTTSTVNLKTIQSWILQILESLESLHKTGLRHKCICPENVMIHVNPETGETSVMLSHPMYIYKLYCMNECHPFDQNLNKESRVLLAAKNGLLIPPEGRVNSNHTPSSKWDLWQVGMLMMQMLVGKREFVKILDEPESYLRSKAHIWPLSLTNFLSSLLHNDPVKRPTALELLTNQFFRTEFELRGEEVDEGLVEGQWVASTSNLTQYDQDQTGEQTREKDQNLLSVMSDQNQNQSGVGGSGGGGSGSAAPNVYGRRRLSSTEESNLSRYKQDFDEGIMLGRGGFGEVVKARNKLDGRVYAVKKIRATTYTLSHILQEVVLLSRLNHQYVVRYYTVWLEDDFDQDPIDLPESAADSGSGSESESSIDDTLSSLSHSLSRLTGKSLTEQDILDSMPSTFSDHHSLSALDLPSVSQDFMSDSGFIQFGFSDPEEEEQLQQDGNTSGTSGTSETKNTIKQHRNEETNEVTPNVSASISPVKLAKLPRKTLYIQMEYCQNHTLGDLIKQGLYKRPNEYWRLLRQILVALSYIHGEGVIHRDLKPKNIFIDQANNIKIGDFGLARRMVQPVQSRQISAEPYQTNSGGSSSGGSGSSAQTSSGTIGSSFTTSSSTINGSSSVNGSSSTTPSHVAYSDMVDEDLTTDVGTSLYAAVEITSGVNQKRGYNEKVDIFSLGIIFFEMVWGMQTEMERIQTIRRARSPHIELPRQLTAAKEMVNQVELIKLMLNHDPKSRPSAMGLLKSGKIPVEDREMTVQEALQNVRDPRVVQQLANALFSQPLISAQQVLYDRTNVSSIVNRRSGHLDDMTTYLGRLTSEYVAEKLKSVFRSHGAVDNTDFRSKIFPRSPLYKMPTVFEILDSQGTVLQLPHDLTFPHARRLAEVIPEYSKSCAFGRVFRALLENPGHHPATHFEVDFDIVSTDQNQNPTQNENNMRFAEAETMAVMHDSAYEALPDSENQDLVLVIGHHDILSATLSHCGLSPPQHYTALSMLGATSSLDRRGSAALARSNISSASLDMLSRFAFRETLDKAQFRVSKLMPISERIRLAFEQVREVVEIFNELTASNRSTPPPVYFSPLMHTTTSEFYVNGVIFQLIDNKDGSSLKNFGTGSVLAVGGRYDNLIKSLRNTMLDARTPLAKAVGFGMSADKIAATVLKNNLPQTVVPPPRCQVIVSSLSDSTLRSQGFNLLRVLWGHGISADIITDVVSTEDLIDKATEQRVPYLVLLRQATNNNNVTQQSNGNTTNTFKPLRVKRISLQGLSSQTDTDLSYNELIPFLQTELQLTTSGSALPSSANITTEYDQYESPATEETNNLNSKVVLLNDYGKIKGGRKNKWQLEERSLEAKQNYISSMSSAPVVCVDLRDDIINAIRTVSPHVTEDWKRRVVGLSPNQKAYIMNIQGKISNEASKHPFLLLFSLKTENIFLYEY